MLHGTASVVDAGRSTAWDRHGLACRRQPNTQVPVRIANLRAIRTVFCHCVEAIAKGVGQVVAKQPMHEQICATNAMQQQLSYRL
jgi:hypothetical protein